MRWKWVLRHVVILPPPQVFSWPHARHHPSLSRPVAMQRVTRPLRTNARHRDPPRGNLRALDPLLE